VPRDVPRLRAAKFTSRAGVGSRRAYSASTPDLGETVSRRSQLGVCGGGQDSSYGGGGHSGSRPWRTASANLVRVAPERRKDCALRLCASRKIPPSAIVPCRIATALARATMG
jgi:hypothetical protein